MRSPKFLSADGGYARVAWMPSDLKEQVKAFIPPSLVDKIATEKEVKTVSGLGISSSKMLIRSLNAGKLKRILLPENMPVRCRYSPVAIFP